MKYRERTCRLVNRCRVTLLFVVDSHGWTIICYVWLIVSEREEKHTNTPFTVRYVRRNHGYSYGHRQYYVQSAVWRTRRIRRNDRKVCGLFTLHEKNRNREWKIKIFTDRSKTIKFFFSVKFSFIYRDINHLPCKNSKIFDGREHNALGTCKRNIDLYIFEITPRTIVWTHKNNVFDVLQTSMCRYFSDCFFFFLSSIFKLQTIGLNNDLLVPNSRDFTCSVDATETFYDVRGVLLDICRLQVTHGERIV